MARVNPVLPGFNPDPSITRAGDDYFLATSSFEYFPGVPIYHSKDLIRWKLIGHALTRTSQIQLAGPEPGGGVWAPTLRYHDNIFYLATSRFDRFRPQQDERLYTRGFYVKTANIWDSSSWSDPVFFDVIGFDQDLFWDVDGTVYLSTTHVKADHQPDADKSRLDFAIHICKVSLETGDSTTEPVMIRESPSGISEGSHIFRRRRFYYLVTAEGGTGSRHSVWVFRNEQGPLGVWQPCPANPLLSSNTDDDVQNTGHADFIEDANGQWWAVLLGLRPRRGDSGEWVASVFGRETFAVPVQWVDDWPIINGGEKISVGAELKGHAEEVWKDDFSQAVLGLGWYRKNTPEKIDYSITTDPCRLRLHGGPYNLSIPASPTMFLRKQTFNFCTWETKLSFNPTTELEEAGSVVWWNYFTYSSIGIRKGRGDEDSDSTKASRIICFRPAHGKTIRLKLCRQDSDVYLYIRCGNQYEFGFSESSKPGNEDLQVHWLGEVSNKVMTSPPPVGLDFSGMMLGLYAFSEYQKSRNPAEFHYVQCRLQDSYKR